MKRIYLFAAVTAIALAACTKTETTGVSEGNLIKFDNAFVGNPTKAVVPQVTNGTFQNFYVYALEDATALFENERVYLSNGKWAYDNLKKWNDAVTAYSFAAYSNGGVDDTTDGKIEAGVSFDGTEGLKITDYVVSYADQRDLVVSYSSATLADANVPVDFAFSHALAMVKFTIESSLGDNDITITDFKVNNFKNKATLTLANSASEIAWTEPSENASISNEPLTANTATPAVSDEFVVIPQTVSGATVTFTATINVGSDIVKTITATIPNNTDFKPGYRYNFVATITGTDMDVIEFAAPTVTEWETYQDSNTNVTSSDAN